MKIKNSPYKNLFGGGNQKEITTDDGKTYIIKNSPYKNLHGEGHQQIIEEKKDSSRLLELPFWGIVFAFLFLLSCPAFVLSLPTGDILRIGLCLLIPLSFAIGFFVFAFGRRGIFLDVFLWSIQVVGFLLIVIVGGILIIAAIVLLLSFILGALAG